VACWYQLLDQQGADDREGRFGLFDTSLKAKPAAAAYKEAVALAKPVPVAPVGVISTDTPAFSWQPAAGAVRYTLWVNEYDTPNVPGKINVDVTPEEAGCQAGGTCQYNPGVMFRPANAEWWVTAYSAGGASALSAAASFTVSEIDRATMRRPTSGPRNR